MNPNGHKRQSVDGIRVGKPESGKAAFDHLRPATIPLAQKRTSKVVPNATSVPQKQIPNQTTRPYSPLIQTRHKNPKKPLIQPAIRRRRSQVYQRNWVELIIIITLLVGVVVILRSAIATQLAIMAYALITWIRRIDSQTTFALAVASLCTVILLLLFRPQTELAASFAEYAFLLLIIGTVSLIIETRRNVA